MRDLRRLVGWISARRWARSVVVVLVALFVRCATFGSFPRDGYDEGVYGRYATTLATEGVEGFRRLLTAYPTDPRLSFGPPPTRIAYVAVASLPCRLGGSCHDDATSLAWIALVAGVGLCVLSSLLFYRWLDAPAAWWASLLVALSPLGLAMSRRALQDTWFGVAAIAFILVCERWKRGPSRRAWLAVMVVGALGLLTKEAMLVVMMIQLAIQGMNAPRSRLRLLELASAVAGAVLASVGVLAWICGGLESLGAVTVHYLRQADANPYTLARQGGRGPAASSTS